MIYLKLRGGLGNQLFQYAFGKKIQEEYDEPLTLDCSSFSKMDDFRLSNFSLSENILSFKKHFVWDFFYALKIKKIICFNPPLLFSFQFHRKYGNLPRPYGRNWIIDGYWQGLNFLPKNLESLRKEFAVKTPPNDKNLEMMRKIKETNSVFVHIRRGDYLSSRKTKNLYEYLDEKYYTRAFEFFNKNTTNPTFFIFSNDLDWVRKTFSSSEKMIFVDINDSKHDYEEFRLMVSCNHAIIANSTFSWWAAFLISNTQKMVVVPQKWFTNEAQNPHELYEKNWILL